MRFVLPTTYARTRIYRPHRETVARESLQQAEVNDVHLTTDDGLILNGWHTVPRTPQAGPRPLILYFPGASGHRGYRVAALEMLTRLGCDVLLIDYRGYGDNAGHPSERNQARDAHGVWRYARQKLHVPAERIVLYGESIGGGVGTRLANELCRAGTAPGGLILQATFASMLDVVAQFFPRLLGSFFLIDRFPSARRIRDVTCPILSIHGDQDRLIPLAMGRRLFDAAPATSSTGQPKEFLELSGVGHNEILDDAGDVVEQTIARFLRLAVPCGRTDASGTGVNHSDLVQPLP